MTERLQTAETAVLAGIGLLRGVCELVYYETVGRHKFEAKPAASIQVIEGSKQC